MSATFQTYAKIECMLVKTLGSTLGLRLGCSSEFKYEEHMNWFNDDMVRERTNDGCAEIGCSLLWSKRGDTRAVPREISFS